MKKKIAIVFNRMIVGGAEKACINFLKNINHSEYDIYLFTTVKDNPYIDEIPIYVCVCDISKCVSKERLINDIRKIRLSKVVRGLFCRAMLRITKDNYKKHVYSCKVNPLSDVYFDCVIAYKANYADTSSALYALRGNKKAAIVHSDLSDDSNVVSEFGPHVERFDKIFCVSQSQLARTNRIYPCLSKKTAVMLNTIDYDGIKALADKKIMSLNSLLIVTVGRLSSEKGQQMIPETARMLVDAGYDIHWYLVGDGPLREEVEREIEKHGVSDRVILLGTQSNPYPYIKNCDIYVQPSFSEGYCTTTMEAKILQKPIVTTDAPGMREQFVSGENGLIVDAMTPEALFDGIKTLIDHPEMREKFVENLEKEDHDNSKEMQKLYDFIEGKE